MNENRDAGRVAFVLETWRQRPWMGGVHRRPRGPGPPVRATAPWRCCPPWRWGLLGHRPPPGSPLHIEANSSPARSTTRPSGTLLPAPLEPAERETLADFPGGLPGDGCRLGPDRPAPPGRVFTSWTCTQLRHQRDASVACSAGAGGYSYGALGSRFVTFAAPPHGFSGSADGGRDRSSGAGIMNESQSFCAGEPGGNGRISRPFPRAGGGTDPRPLRRGPTPLQRRGQVDSLRVESLHAGGTWRRSPGRSGRKVPGGARSGCGGHAAPREPRGAAEALRRVGTGMAFGRLSGVRPRRKG
jgi:hypothetical protein